MTPFTDIPEHIEEALAQSGSTASRRDFLKGSGLFVISLGATSVASHPLAALAGAAQAPALGAGPYPDPNYKQLDSWIVIRPDSTATFYVGKTDLGQGTGTAFRQIMADELDIAYDKTSVVMGARTSRSIKAARGRP